MGNPYRDIARLATAPADVEQFPALTPGDVRLDGLAVPYATEPLPIILTPGFEYRIREVGANGTAYWVLERRHI